MSARQDDADRPYEATADEEPGVDEVVDADERPEEAANDAAASVPGPEAAAFAPDVVDDAVKVAAERDEYLDALRRLQAEFENYRKRTARQQSELLERATVGLLERLLPVLDAFDLALAHAPSSTESGSTVANGADVAAFGRIASLLRDLLEKDGLERIDAVAVAFDPEIHDAVAHLPASQETASDAAPDEGDAMSPPVHHEPSVAEVLRAGYRLKGRVLRPAMVTVKG